MESPASEKVAEGMRPVEGQPIPGTVCLVDKQHRFQAKHSSTQRDIVLVPTPSSDPDDPLNWSPRRKILSTVCTFVYEIAVGLSSAAIYSVLVPIAKDTGLSVTFLNQGTGYMFLLFGWGCVFWQPIALQYGKRPVYLISLFATMAIMIWQPHTKTSGQYIASKILQGFFGAPIESLCEISIADIWFQHERGKYFAAYGFLLAAVNYFGPFIMGFITQDQGWSWMFDWCSIFCAVVLVFNFFFMEETNWNRAIDDATEAPRVASEASTEQINSSKEEVEGPMPSKSQKTFLQKMSVWPQKQPFRLFKIMPRPFFYFGLPAVAWSGFAFGLSLVWTNVMNATASSILSVAPYHFTPSQVGLTYLAPLLGATLSAVWTGNLGDWLVLRLARRNGGILEAESRLWLFSLACIVMPVSLILWGVGAAHHVHWFGLVFAIFLKGLVSAMGIAMSVIYTLDSYRGIGGEAIVAMVLVRNTMSFAINYAINPWIAGMGLQNAFILAAFVSLIGFSTFLPIIKYGKRLRAWTANRYWRYLEEEKKLGLVH